MLMPGLFITLSLIFFLLSSQSCLVYFEFLLKDWISNKDNRGDNFYLTLSGIILTVTLLTLIGRTIIFALFVKENGK